MLSQSMPHESYTTGCLLLFWEPLQDSLTPIQVVREFPNSSLFTNVLDTGSNHAIYMCTCSTWIVCLYFIDKPFSLYRTSIESLLKGHWLPRRSLTTSFFWIYPTLCPISGYSDNLYSSQSLACNCGCSCHGGVCLCPLVLPEDCPRRKETGSHRYIYTICTVCVYTCSKYLASLVIDAK